MADFLRNEYEEALNSFDRCSEAYERACQEYPYVHAEVKDAELDVSCADVALEYALMNNLDSTEADNKLNSAKTIYKDALFRMNALVPDAYENKVLAELRYTTARRAYYQTR